MSRRTPIPKTLGRPRSVDSAETRNILLDVARRTFAKDGYGASTNRSIAEAAGLTAAAIYHYFPSKAELFAAVYHGVEALVGERFEIAMEQPGSLTDRFGRILDAAGELNHEDSSLAGFVLSVPTEMQRHPELHELLGVDRSRSIPFITRLVADAVANGEFVDGVDPGGVEDLLTSVISGLTVFSTLTEDPDRHLAAIRTLRLFLSGDLVRRPPPPARSAARSAFVGS